MTIFSRIIAGEIPCYKIAETENCFAFLDINPLVKGHVLCIPVWVVVRLVTDIWHGVHLRVRYLRIIPTAFA